MLNENIKWNEKQHATNYENIFMHHIFANPWVFCVILFIGACLSYKYEFTFTYTDKLELFAISLHINTD